MPDFGRTGDNFSGDNEPSFDDIRRSDSFVDALAGGGPVAPEDPADAALAALLGGWRDEMRWPPATGLISEPQAIAALDAGLAEKSGGLRRDKRADKQVASVTPMKNRRGLSVVGAAAAAVLCLGGFGAVVAGAGPGDALYGLRSMLFGAPKEVRDDAVALAARSELNQVQELIAQGDWQQAQEKLVAVSTQVASIGDEQQKQDLFDEFNDLSAKVVERDPAATAAPGIIYTVPETAAELVPAVAPPTSVPTAPSPSDPTSAATPTSTSAEQTGTSASPDSTTATTGAPTSSQSPASATTTQTATPTTTRTSAAPVTTSAPSAATSSVASSAASSTPSAAQATSSAAVTTTSAAPRVTSTSPASSPVSTTAAAPTTTTGAPVASPAQATTTQAQTTVETTVETTAAPTEDSSPADSSPTDSSPEDSSPEDSAPTTTAVPIPVTTTTVPVAAG